jgi:hypothetical protein
MAYLIFLIIVIVTIYQLWLKINEKILSNIAKEVLLNFDIFNERNYISKVKDKFDIYISCHICRENIIYSNGQFVTACEHFPFKILDFEKERCRV